MEALSRLEASGFPVLSSLNSDVKLFRHFFELTIYIVDNSTLDLDSWLRGFSKIPPSWKNLLLFIRQLHLNDLAQQIETYLSAGTIKEPSELRENEAAMAEGGERIW